jgi:aminoglycoside phosphotransferase (APT) family kinase protein
VGFIRSDEAGLVDALGRVHKIDRTACRRHVGQRFSVERMVDKHVALYEQAIASTSRTADLLFTGAA